MKIEEVIKEFLENELMPHLAHQDETNANLLASGLDSIKLMRMIHFIEDKFGITLPNEYLDPANFSSIQSISTIVDKVKTSYAQDTQ